LFVAHSQVIASDLDELFIAPKYPWSDRAFLLKNQNKISV